MHRDPAPPSERSTGLVFAAMACIIAVLRYRHPGVWIPAGVLALGFALISLFVPRTLRSLNLLWFRFSMLVYKVVNPVVMLLMYAIAIVPIGLIVQCFHDPLQAKQQRGQKSYWMEPPVASDSGSMKNQF